MTRNLHRSLSVPAFAALLLATGVACQPATPPASAPAAPAPTSAAPAAAQQTQSAPAAPAAQPVQTSAPAAPAAAPTRIAPAAPTSTPSPLLALTPPQRAAAAEGQRALAAGDYTRAVDVLRPLAGQVVAGAARTEVQLLLAQAQVGARAYDDALTTAQALGSADPAARLVKGQALRGLKRWDEAAVEMRAAADAEPRVDAAVRLQLAEMWLGAGKPDQAAADARKGVDGTETRLLKIDLAERLASTEVAQRNTDAAMEAYRQLLTAAGSKGFLGEQLYNLGLGANQLGKKDEAIRALRTSISDFPRSRKAPDAVNLLESIGGMRPEDRFYSGVIRYYFWEFKKARADFDAYLAAFPDGDRAVEARYYRGLSSLPADTTEQLLKLADQFPDDEFAPLALLEAGKAQEELEKYDSAEAIYARLIATFPTRDAGLAGTFRRGLSRLMQKDTAGALAIWDGLAQKDVEPALKAQSLYWAGKALATRGDTAGARARWQAASNVRPVDYYVVRALAELNPPPPTADFNPASAAPADEAALGAWFAERKIDLASASREAAAQPAYDRAATLVRYGLYREANWEYEGFLTQYVDKPAQLYWLAARFGDLGLPNAQLKLGTAALAAATAEGQVSVLDVPKALQRVAFPLAFPDMVTGVAKQNGLDPLLFEGLIRQESDFDPYAESVVKAKGLSQIMPDTTGPEIAGKLGVKDYSPESLFEAKRNVQFGAFYFAERLKRNGRVPQKALAAYNAGDGNVDNWTGAGREDPDVFAEYIAFFETHDYVQRIYTYWTLNRYIWGG
ncbi:MAG: transglycosylase SLT domain-containing protein [Chloroflexi bacterium]|nr:transglycosylase SLT domain-containing protein [Chloroflexota bacterium]